MECVNCSKELGFMKYKSDIGLLCKKCKFEEIDNRPTPSMKGLRIGLGIISVIAAIALIYSLLS